MNRRMMVILACALAACGPGEGPPGESQRASPENASNFVPAAVAQAARTIRIHPDHPPYGLVLYEREGVVDSLGVLRETRHVQTLAVSENAPTPSIDRVSTPDLDFDGHADLALVTELAAGTSRSDYWRFDSASGRYVALGNHETLQVDSAAQSLTTFNRGGHGGRIWTAAQVGVADGALVLLREEEQAWVENALAYVRVVRERRGGTLVEISRDTISESELRAGPSWGPDDQ